jgi:SAM-dependent methyltransferase
VKNKYFLFLKKNQSHLIRDIIQWDVGSWSKILKYWDKNINWSTVDTCLELGGRKGGLSLWLALKRKAVICSDLSNAQEQAELLHSKYKVDDLITYKNIDATNIPYENQFDIIVFKSIIGGIKNNIFENQQKVFDEIYKALKPGGKLLFAENLTGSFLHQFLRRMFVERCKSGRWRYITLHEVKFFLNQYKNYSINTTGLIGVFGQTEWQRNLLSFIDDVVLNHVCPDNWKYISYGIAEK